MGGRRGRSDVWGGGGGGAVAGVEGVLSARAGWGDGGGDGAAGGAEVDVFAAVSEAARGELEQPSVWV